MTKEYKVGDEVWYVPGFLAIKCRIKEVDDHFKKQHPKAHLFYVIDEPVGHSLAADECLEDRERP
ncbi:MAG: hypothetical protein GF334_04990 [Candidatus Altiarchaeales archaeon]|nr:hypothetical protein [Candidatus Altiarchaeales archaeon]